MGDQNLNAGSHSEQSMPILFVQALPSILKTGVTRQRTCDHKTNFKTLGSHGRQATLMSTTPETEKRVEERAKLPVKSTGRWTENIARGPRSISLALIWGVFLMYALFLAPGEGVSPVITEILKHPFNPDVNTIYFSIFNLLGAIGAVYVALLAPAEDEQPVPLGPFGFASLFLGYFGIGPYLALRNFCPQETSKSKLRRLGKITESKAFALGLVVFSIVFYALALGAGDEAGLRDALFYTRTSELVQLFQTDRLVNVSMVDFTLLTLLIWGPLGEDMQRRRLLSEQSPVDAFTALIIMAAPVLGPSLYLLLRPSLKTDE